jgi:acyl dehydratase
MQIDLRSPRAGDGTFNDEISNVSELLTYDSFHIGQTIELGWVSASEGDIVDFATRFDPQLFHVDVEKARSSLYNGIIASGWHTAGLFMRLYVDRILSHAACLGSPGVDELRWIAPVRPGQRLLGVLTVERKQPSKSRPDRGTLYPRCELFDEEGRLVFSMVLRTLLRRQPTSV